MSKKNIIFICVAVAVAIILAFVVYFAIIKNVNNNGISNAEKIVITKYNDNFEVEKTVEITDKKQIREINKLCENPSLEQDDTTPYLAIRNDIKIDLGNGIFFMLQADLEEYCYYENPESNTKIVIKMPDGLLQKSNKVLSAN